MFNLCGTTDRIIIVFNLLVKLPRGKLPAFYLLSMLYVGRTYRWLAWGDETLAPAEIEGINVIQFPYPESQSGIKLLSDDHHSINSINCTLLEADDDNV